MNTYQHFELRLEPREELRHLVAITAGLLASGKCVPFTGNYAFNGNDEEIFAKDVSRQLLEQLRWDVERRVEEFPECYANLAGDQMPSE